MVLTKSRYKLLRSEFAVNKVAKAIIINYMICRHGQIGVLAMGFCRNKPQNFDLIKKERLGNTVVKCSLHVPGFTG